VLEQDLEVWEDEKALRPKQHLEEQQSGMPHVPPSRVGVRRLDLLWRAPARYS
jgi:hypothetical protein